MSDSASSSPRPLLWIVDDSPTEAAFTERSLGADYHFERFADGTTVVEKLSATTRLPDLLILDWVMPGMTGDEVCRFLRSRPATRELPIIIVTASRVETLDIVAGLANGANDYVPRPFAPEELRARVNAALRTKQLADLATRERQRLTSINRLGHALFQSTDSAAGVVDILAQELTAELCDGCAVLILPGPLPSIEVARRRLEGGADELARIASVADPVIHAFDDSAHARATLPPAYASYIDHHGLRGLAILPFPTHEPIRGVVTLTREAGSEPFDAADIATIETCIEHTSLAVDRVLRFDAERVGRTQLNTVLESLPIGIVATDENDEIVMVNQAASALIPNIANARTSSDVFMLATWSASDGAVVTSSDVFGGAHGSLRTSIDLQLAVDGEAAARTIAVSTVPLRNASGHIVGSVMVFEDVSAERAISADRERIAKFQEEMLAIVGHDLRSPLGAIFAGVELLNFGLEPESTPGKTVRRIYSSANRMARIIEQVLDVTHTRLGAGIPIVRREMDLVPGITSVIDEVSLAYPKTRFELRRAVDVRGMWDPDRLEQVVSNLLSNAAQYGRAGEPVTIVLARTDATVQIAIRNQIAGEPIPSETLAVMFRPYQRGTTSKHGSGLGLGLYIVHGIVRAHRGTIDVESTREGTVFTVTLPIDAPDAPPPRDHR